MACYQGESSAIVVSLSKLDTSDSLPRPVAEQDERLFLLVRAFFKDGIRAIEMLAYDGPGSRRCLRRELLVFRVNTAAFSCDGGMPISRWDSRLFR